MKILYGVSSLGLGHANRSLPIIKHLLKENELIILTYEKAYKFLKEELKDYKNIKFIEFVDYPNLQRGKGLMFFYYILKDSINSMRIIKKEQKFIKNLVKNEKIDLIISDGKYGTYSKKIPSFLISHQIKLILPKKIKLFQKIADFFNYKKLKRFTMILIPDYKEENNNISGILSHNNYTKKLNHRYIGILSSYKQKKVLKKDIDYYFILSGFLKETKKKLIDDLIQECINLKGKKVLSLGETNSYYHKKDIKNNIEIYSYVSGDLKNDLMNRSKIIVSRSGYTHIMDMVELNKKSLINPTPNQAEQEYLADYLNKNNYFRSFDSTKKFDLKDLVKKVDTSKGFYHKLKTKDTIKNIDEIIKKATKLRD